MAFMEWIFGCLLGVEWLDIVAKHCIDSPLFARRRDEGHISVLSGVIKIRELVATLLM